MTRKFLYILLQRLTSHTKNDMQFVAMIAKAYAYITNKQIRNYKAMEQTLQPFIMHFKNSDDS